VGSIAASIVVGLAALLIATSSPSVAQERPIGDDLNFSVGGRLWVTSGYSSRRTGAAGIDRLSELRWRGVDSLVPEINADLVWKRFVLLGSIGGGSISNGVLLDEDFDASGTRVSSTRSPVDDSYLFYVNTDIGGRVFDWTMPDATARGYVDVLVGFQYWHERYVAFGATGFPATVSSGTKAISNDYHWRSLRLGARTQVPIYRGFSLNLRGYVIPWSSLVVEDVHYLRGDLRKDPSFRDEADGGIGWQADGSLNYSVTKNLSVELGFQYWMQKSAEGDQFAFTTAAGTVHQTVKEARSERYGPFVGVRWRF
jgi:hypothetical protein